MIERIQNQKPPNGAAFANDLAFVPESERAHQGDRAHPTPGRTILPRSRVGGLWLAAVAFAFVLLLLLIFVLENGQRAEVSYFGAHGQLPMGVALLLAAVFGILLVALPGSARIVQLRMLDRRSRHLRRRRSAVPSSTESDAGPDQDGHR
jgi:uncharacterized integral membrane protein